MLTQQSPAAEKQDEFQLSLQCSWALTQALYLYPSGLQNQLQDASWLHNLCNFTIQHFGDVFGIVSTSRPLACTPGCQNGSGTSTPTLYVAFGMNAKGKLRRESELSSFFQPQVPWNDTIPGANVQACIKEAADSIPIQTLFHHLGQGYKVVMTGYGFGGMVAQAVALKLLVQIKQEIALAQQMGLNLSALEQTQDKVVAYAFCSPLWGDQQIKQCALENGISANIHNIWSERDASPYFFTLCSEVIMHTRNNTREINNTASEDEHGRKVAAVADFLQKMHDQLQKRSTDKRFGQPFLCSPFNASLLSSIHHTSSPPTSPQPSTAVNALRSDIAKQTSRQLSADHVTVDRKTPTALRDALPAIDSQKHSHLRRSNSLETITRQGTPQARGALQSQQIPRAGNNVGRRASSSQHQFSRAMSSGLITEPKTVKPAAGKAAPPKQVPPGVIRTSRTQAAIPTLNNISHGNSSLGKTGPKGAPSSALGKSSAVSSKEGSAGKTLPVSLDAAKSSECISTNQCMQSLRNLRQALDGLELQHYSPVGTFWVVTPASPLKITAKSAGSFTSASAHTAAAASMYKSAAAPSKPASTAKDQYGSMIPALPPVGRQRLGSTSTAPQVTLRNIEINKALSLGCEWLSDLNPQLADRWECSLEELKVQLMEVAPWITFNKAVDMDGHMVPRDGLVRQTDSLVLE